MTWMPSRLLGVFALITAAAVCAHAGEEKIEKLPLPDGSAKIAGMLTSADARDKVRKQPCKVYAVDLQGGQTYQIDMTTVSKELDPFLRLEDLAGKELASDDDSGGFPNARIVFACPRDGTYRLIATTFGTGLGAFELSVKKAAELSFKNGEAKVASVLAPSDPKDAVRKTPCKIFVLQLVKGKTYQIDMKSKQLDSFLRLENAAGEQLAQDDDGGDGLDARIVFACPADGSYRIIATAIGNSTGPFTLEVRAK